MGVKGLVKSLLRSAKGWLEEGETEPAAPPDAPPIPFDNSYTWLFATMLRVMKDPIATKRPHYVLGVLQGAALGKVLGLNRVTVAEIGVAGGAGLLAMQRVAEICEALADIRIDVYGFDTGVGIPKPQDYRDMPYKWAEGYYPCDVDQLRQRLRHANLSIGLLKDTVPAFLGGAPSPLAFVGFDTGMYSSTKDAMGLLQADHSRLIPRMPCSFRSAIGKDVTEFGAELLAISEFNASHQTRKLSTIKGLTYFVPPQFRWWWIDTMYSLHVFDHPMYGNPDAYRLSSSIDCHDNEHFHAASG
ncbi:MAG: hypothetical protein AB7G48_13430 [Nitrospiraceae bacterium]